MPKSGKNSLKISNYLLIIGGILSILPNIPVVNEILSILRWDFNILNTNYSGGINFLESFGKLPLNIQITVTGWTSLGLDGNLLFIVFVGLGALAIIVALVLKSKQLVLLTGIIAGVVEIVLLGLIFLGDSQKTNAFGLSNFLSTSSEFVGSGFWVLMIGSILLLVGGFLAIKE